MLTNIEEATQRMPAKVNKTHWQGGGARPAALRSGDKGRKGPGAIVADQNLGEEDEEKGRPGHQAGEEPERKGQEKAGRLYHLQPHEGTVLARLVVTEAWKPEVLPHGIETAGAQEAAGGLEGGPNLLQLPVFLQAPSIIG